MQPACRSGRRDREALVDRVRVLDLVDRDATVDHGVPAADPPASESKRNTAGFVLPVSGKSLVLLWTWPVGAPPGIVTEPDLGDGAVPDASRVERRDVRVVVRYPEWTAGKNDTPHAFTSSRSWSRPGAADPRRDSSACTCSGLKRLNELIGALGDAAVGVTTVPDGDGHHRDGENGIATGTCGFAVLHPLLPSRCVGQ